MMERTCPVCGDPIVRRVRETLHDFLQRKSCGKAACAQELRVRWNHEQQRAQGHAPPGEGDGRVCIVCGAPLIRHEREQGYRFRRRLTCGTKTGCAAKARQVPADRLQPLYGERGEKAPALTHGGMLLPEGADPQDARWRKIFA
jgi:hypothetical protein